MTAEVHAAGPLPAGLLEAFWRYDRALLRNDRETLNELFMPGEDTLRGDGRGLLVGHDAIAGFRSGRTAIPTRRIERVHVQTITERAALIMACTRDRDATGLQTQLWRDVGGRWVVAAAHVTAPAAPGAAFDRAVWRVLGDPLVPPRAPGILDGLGVAVKDLFSVAGHPVGGGVPAWLAEQQPQPEHAPAVAALLDAGAHVAGLARTDEFAYSLAGTNVHYGTPPNPAVPGGISGGSSSGPASAVALGQAAIGLGTDTAGSIRVPASYQGLVGLRSTHGAIPCDGVLPLAPSFDTVGWLTRDLRTASLVAEVLLPAETGCGGELWRVPEVEALAHQDVLEALGSTVDKLVTGEQSLPPDEWERWFAAFRTVQGFEAWQAHGQWISAHPGALGPDVADRFQQGAAVTTDAVRAAREIVGEARERLRGWLDTAVLAIPSAATAAPSRTATAAEVERTRASTLRMTCLAGLAGAPALSLPLMRSAEGHPVGLCLIGAPGADRSLLDLARRMEIA